MIEPRELEASVVHSGAFRCLECGKCTAVCPVSRYDAGFSPRRTVGRAIMQRDESLLGDDRLWACLTCLKCTQVCPAAVSYADLTLAVREAAARQGRAATCTHGEVLHAWMHMMADEDLEQQRLGWLEGQDLVTDDASDTLFFVGCAPYFQVQFGPLGVDAVAVPQASVRALNHVGIAPQVLADERCCGHDLLWEGDVEGFERLARLNAERIRESAAKRIVTSCPECARALAVDYPAHGIDLGVEVRHLSQIVAEALASESEAADETALPRPSPGRLRGRATAGMAEHADEAPPLGTAWDPDAWDAVEPTRNGAVTYHDPCRLGRHLGVFEAPRVAMQRLGVDLVEMPRSRESAECCGTNGWSHCGAANKQIQTERLQEARATGARTLVTGCLKCQIHFRCAMQDRRLGADSRIEIRDLSTLLAEGLDRRRDGPTEGD